MSIYEQPETAATGLVQVSNCSIHFDVEALPSPGLAISHPVSVPKMNLEFPNWKFWIKIPEIPKIQYWTGNFLLGTKICYINQDQTRTVKKKSCLVLKYEISSLVSVPTIREMIASPVSSCLVSNELGNADLYSPGFELRTLTTVSKKYLHSTWCDSTEVERRTGN